MKLIGNLKDKVENAKSKDEAKAIISKAGMELTADELDIVVGGSLVPVKGCHTLDNSRYSMKKDDGIITDIEIR